jgi:hypothetical protein
MKRVTAAEARAGYRLWLRFSDSVEGEVDLSHLVGKGVFSAWLTNEAFAAVRVNEFGAPEWPGDIDLCPDSLYSELTGQSMAEVFASSRDAVSA